MFTPAPDADRNLLFGVLAMQADLLDPDRFAEACAAWAARKDGALADLLLARGWLTPADRGVIDRLLELKLARHGDARASIAAVADHHVRETLSRIDALTPLPEGPAPSTTIDHRPAGPERYTRTRLHAEGGIGQVWLAHDAGLGRQVALKELRPERAGSSAALARFLDEARVTGQLEHPGIVPVYELDRSAGDPFYTMRFVHGRTLAEAVARYHDRRRTGAAGPLELRELLTAFVAVCNAVAYAHSRGVVHRDLKPQNVVLGDFGEAILLDWGLAKVVDRPADPDAPPVLSDPATPHDQTAQGSVVGTPAYMAPEQASGRIDQIGPVTDVHGLGAILYEILTGRPPFRGGDTQDVLRQVVREPPTAPRGLAPHTPPPLEAVCLKALAKKPADRYPSARALAEDLRHHLADEPVSVLRERWPARAARWGRRHKPLVTGSAAVLVAAVVALGVGTVLLQRANGETARERNEAQAQRDLARENFRKARQAVDDYFTRVSESTLLKSPLPGLQPLRKELLETAQANYRDFAAAHQDDPSVQPELARAHYRLGRITEEIGTKRDALGAYTASLALWERVVAADPDPAYQGERAACLRAAGNLRRSSLGETEEGVRALHQARELYERLAQEHTDDPEFRKGLADTYDSLGSASRPGSPEELDYYRRALAIWEGLPADPEVEFKRAGMLMVIGYFHTRFGTPADALRHHERARDVFARLSGAKPYDVKLRQELGRVYVNIGYVYHSRTRRYEDALKAYNEAIRIWGGLARENPAARPLQEQYASILIQTGGMLQKGGRSEDSLRFLRPGLDLLEKDARVDPEDVRTLDEMANGYKLLAEAHLDAHRYAEALQAGRKVLNVAEGLVHRQPDRVWNFLNLARGHRTVAEASQGLGQTAEALAALQEAAAVLDRFRPAPGEDTVDLRRDLALVWHARGTVHLATGQPAEAAAAFRRAAEVQEGILRQRPKDPPILLTLAQYTGDLGEAYAALRQPAEAAAAFQQALAALERSGPPGPVTQRLLANCCLGLGSAQRDAGRPAEAEQALTRAEQALEKLTAANDLYKLACARALRASLVGGGKADLTPAEKERRDQFAAQAVQALRRAVQAGYKDLQHLKTDSDLDALRKSPDFQKFFADLAPGPR
jgi:serine/threonine-protein kinase